MFFRKAVLTIGVVAVFIGYSLVLRHQHSSPVIAPTNLKNNSNNANNNSNSSNSNSSSNSSGTSSNTGSSTGSGSGTTAATYKDGTYTGSVADAYYGNVQVSVVISGGKITTVNFLQHPDENPNSVYINSQAMPYLKQEAIQAQSANVSGVSGATLTSQAFIQSLSSALNQANS